VEREGLAIEGIVWLRLTAFEFSFCVESATQPQERQLKRARRAFFIANLNSLR
jgi:hypothetical protein